MILDLKPIRSFPMAAFLFLVSSGMWAQSEPASSPAPAAAKSAGAAPTQNPDKGRSDDAYVIGANDVLAVNHRNREQEPENQYSRDGG